MSEEKIKILELRTVSGTGGGPEKTIFMTAKKLDSSRFETHIIYTRNLQDPQFNWMKRHYALPEGVHYEEYIEKHSYDPRLLKYLYQYCQRYRIDILHSHEYKTDVLCGLIRKKLAAKWVSTFHAAAFSSWKLKLYQYLAYRQLRKADRVFMVSPQQKTLLLHHRIPEGILCYLPNGVDTDVYCRSSVRNDFREKWGCQRETVVLGFMGRLCSEKNILLLLKAFGVVLKQEENLLLVLAGEGPERNKVGGWIKDLKQENKTRLLGFVEDTVPFYASLDVYIQSSTTEGMPNTILEAMAMELPVVATNVGGNGELIEDGSEGFLVASGDENALFQSMLKLVRDHKLRREMGKKGRDKVLRHFSFEGRVHQLEEHYERLCQR